MSKLKRLLAAAGIGVATSGIRNDIQPAEPEPIVNHGSQQNAGVPTEAFTVEHSDRAEQARQRMMQENANAWKKVHRKGRPPL